MSKMLMTTGYCFEGYSIEQYLGVFSGECALGTGFLSSLDSDISDFLDTNSQLYSEKLKKAKESALRQLEEETIQAGGNAVVGLSISYIMFSRDIIGVIANGTAVKVRELFPLNGADTAVPIWKYNRNTVFTPMVFCGHSAGSQYSFKVELFHDSEDTIGSILTDVKFISVFEQEMELRDVVFTDFLLAKKNRLVSGYTTVSLPCENLTLLKNVTLVTKKYIKNEELVDLSDMDQELELVSKEERAGDMPVLAEMYELKSSKEIYEYLKDHMEKYNQSEPELMEWMEKKVMIEKFYGGSKEETINYIRDYYGLD